MRTSHGWTVVAAAFVVLFTAHGAQYSFPSASLNLVAVALLAGCRPPRRALATATARATALYSAERSRQPGSVDESS